MIAFKESKMPTPEEVAAFKAKVFRHARESNSASAKIAPTAPGKPDVASMWKKAVKRNTSPATQDAEATAPAPAPQATPAAPTKAAKLDKAAAWARAVRQPPANIVSD